MAIARESWTRSQIGRQVALAGAAALLVGACASGSGASAPPVAPSAAATASPAAATEAVTIGPVGGPVGAPGGGGSGVMITGGGMSGQAIAYPYPGYPGAPGLAPDHTIVVTGFGQASMAADQSDRAAVQQVALKAALADAKSQADLVAAATDVTIQGVLSVSVSSSQGYFGPVPMVVGGAQIGPASSGSVVPMPIQPPVAPTPELDVTVTVAYRIG